MLRSLTQKRRIVRVLKQGSLNWPGYCWDGQVSQEQSKCQKCALRRRWRLSRNPRLLCSAAWRARFRGGLQVPLMTALTRSLSRRCGPLLRRKLLPAHWFFWPQPRDMLPSRNSLRRSSKCGWPCACVCIITFSTTGREPQRVWESRIALVSTCTTPIHGLGRVGIRVCLHLAILMSLHILARTLPGARMKP